MNCRKVSFAASANRSNFERINTVQKQILGRLIESFDVVSVRDRFTKDIIEKHASAKNIWQIPDPTFYLSIPETKVQEILSKSGITPERPFILVLQSDNEINRLIREYCDQKGVFMIATEDINRYANLNMTYNLSVFEWADIFRFASFCVTDRYHGTIFSLKAGTPFLSMDSSGTGRSKIYSLLADIGMTANYSPEVQ
jgi:exopolysaccharide biosynthesis predicted pyruvyltransferase EpsI